MSEASLALQGRRLLIPPARPEVNPLARMLSRRGATVFELPRLIVRPPAETLALEQALEQLDQLRWVIVSGSPSAELLLARLADQPQRREQLQQQLADGHLLLGAIGHGALAALRQAGLEPSLSPRRHVAADVVAEIAALEQQLAGTTAAPDADRAAAATQILLLRVAGASADLPAALRQRGRQLIEAEGYRMVIDLPAPAAAEAFDGALDAVALANPTAVRYLQQAAAGHPVVAAQLQGRLIAVAGPATEREARARGFAVELVAAGGHRRSGRRPDSSPGALRADR